MNILVTGSSGFIGFHLVRKLLKLGHNVIGLDDHNNYYDKNLKLKRNALSSHENFTFFECGLDQLENLKIDKRSIDIAINLAAQPGVRVSDNDKKYYQSTNIDGFKSFCNFCINKEIKNVIYASSSSVYSDSEPGALSEESSELAPKSLYGKSKLSNEKFASNISSQEDISILGLRFFSVYGPFGRPDMAYYKFTESIINQELITLYNDGKMYRDMTYIDDIIQGICGAINYVCRVKCKNEIFNLGANKPIKTSDLLVFIESYLGKKTKINYQESLNESFYTHADISKAKKLIEYMPQTNFKNGMKKFIDWHRDYRNE